MCVDRINGYTCHCNGSYTGVNCSERGLLDKFSTKTSDVTIQCIHVVPSNEEEAPTITRPPKNSQTRLGDPIHLNCTAEGHPTPTYQWYKDGVILPGEIESVLYIPEPSPEDRGNYTCEAINSEGVTDRSRPAKLDITGTYEVLITK